MRAAKQVVGIPLALVMFVAPAWSAQVSSEQRRAVEALEDLNSAVSVGVTYVSYGERVINAKIVVDRFTRTCPRPLKPNSPCDLVTKAMTAYVLARELWPKKINGTILIDRSEIGEDILKTLRVKKPDVSLLRTLGMNTDAYIADAQAKTVYIDDVMQACWSRAAEWLNALHK